MVIPRLLRDYQARRERWKSRGRTFRRFPRRVISAANPRLCPFWRKGGGGVLLQTKSAFTESRIKRPLLQILVESQENRDHEQEKKSERWKREVHSTLLYELYFRRSFGKSGDLLPPEDSASGLWPCLPNRRHTSGTCSREAYCASSGRRLFSQTLEVMTTICLRNAVQRGSGRRVRMRGMRPLPVSGVCNPSATMQIIKPGEGNQVWTCSIDRSGAFKMK